MISSKSTKKIYHNLSKEKSNSKKLYNKKDVKQSEIKGKYIVFIEKKLIGSVILSFT
jgi:hypothetical protein